MVIWHCIYDFFGEVRLRINHVQNFGLLLGYFWLLGARQESRGKLGRGKSPRRPWTYFLLADGDKSLVIDSLQALDLAIHRESLLPECHDVVDCSLSGAPAANCHFLLGP